MRVNGETVEPFAGTVDDFVRSRGAPLRGVAVAIDGEVVPKSLWSVTVLSPDSNVEIVTAAAGG